MRKVFLSVICFICCAAGAGAQDWNGLEVGVGNLYRWHIVDPIRFKKDLKVTVQDLGWRQDKTYLPQHSDIAATSIWYQAEPHAKFPKLPGWRELAID